MLIRIRRKVFNLSWLFSRKSIGANIYIMMDFTERKQGKKIAGLYVGWSSFTHILLGAKDHVPIDEITSVLNHEVLHGVLDKKISYLACKGLDRIQCWNNEKIEFILQ